MRPVTDRRARSPVRFAAGIGAVWGFAGYVLLWGYTPIIVHPPFVVSLVGTALLLPVRIVLWSIRGIERAAGGPFDFSSNNWWIGLLAGAVGAAIGSFIVWGIRALVRRASGRERVAEGGERV